MGKPADDGYALTPAPQKMPSMEEMVANHGAMLAAGAAGNNPGQGSWSANLAFRSARSSGVSRQPRPGYEFRNVARCPPGWWRLVSSNRDDAPGGQRTSTIMQHGSFHGCYAEQLVDVPDGEGEDFGAAHAYTTRMASEEGYVSHSANNKRLRRDEVGRWSSPAISTGKF